MRLKTQTSKLPTLDFISSILNYDPETGLFTNKVKRNSRAMPGGVAGCQTTVSSGKKYIQIRIAGRNYYAHTLAIFYMTGLWPEQQVDHIDGNSLNNRIANLRCVSVSENQHNRKCAQKTSQTGVIGVTWRIKNNREVFISRIKVNMKRIHIGTFSNIADAEAAYLTAKRQLHAGNML